MTPLEVIPLTRVVAEGVREGVAAVTGLSLEVKLPNDLLWKGKKVCGILTESSIRGGRLEYLVVGIGLNVNLEEEDFPPALRSSATSLKMAVGRPVAREVLFEAVLRHVEASYAKMKRPL